MVDGKQTKKGILPNLLTSTYSTPFYESYKVEDTRIYNKFVMTFFISFQGQGNC